MEKRKINRPLPIISVANRGFWEATKKHELRLQKCLSCNKFHYPISVVCPFCHSTEYEWALTKGRGVVDSWVVYHQSFHPAFAEAVPYAVVQVELEEGPRLFANLVGVDPKDIHAGTQVKAVFEDVNEEVTLVQFSPV